MLTALRELLRSKVAAVLIGLLILSLAVWGISDIFRGGLGENIARAGGQSLKSATFAERVDNFLNSERRRTGEVVTRKDIAENGTLDALFSRELNRLLQLGYADRLGAMASNGAVSAEATTIEAFRSPITGEFDAQVYMDVLRRENILVSSFERDVRQDLSLDYVSGGLRAGLVVPDVLAKPSYDFLTERREASFLVLPAAVVPEPEAPSDADILEFYNENQEALQVPERRAISLIVFTSADFRSTIEVPEQDILDTYEAQKLLRFAGPQTATVSYLVYGSEATAQRALAELTVSTPLEQLSAELQPVSVTTQEGLTFEAMAEGRMRDDVFGPLGGEGAVFGPYPLGSTVQLVRVDAMVQGEPTPLETVRDEIRDELADRYAKDAFLDAGDNATRFLGGGYTLAQISAEIGVPVMSYAPVTADGRLQDGRPMGELVGLPQVLAEAQTLPLNEISDPIEIGTDVYALVEVTEIVEPFTPSITELRERLIGAVSRQRAAEAARLFAEDLQTRLRANETTLEAEANTFGTIVLTPPGGMDRLNFPRDIDPQVIGNAFAARAGQIIVMPNRLGGVTAVRIGNVELVPDITGEGMSAIRTQFAEVITGNALEAAFSSVQEDIDLDIDESAFASFRADALGGQ